MVAKNNTKLNLGAENVVRKSIGVTPTDKVCIIHDRGVAEIAQALDKACSNITEDVQLFLMEDLGERGDPKKPLPWPRKLNKVLANSTVTIYAGSSYPGELSSFRKPMLDLVVKHRIKHGHMIHITKRVMEQGVCTPLEQLVFFTRMLYRLLVGCCEIKITSKAGTDLLMRFSPKVHWCVDDGVVIPGHMQNLPGGEVFTAPSSVDGRLVIDGPLGDYFDRFGLLSQTPLVLHISNGKIDKLECANSELLAMMQEYIQVDEYAAYIGELGFGTNIGVKKLIGNMLQDEKFPGVHIAWGNSYPRMTGVNRPSKVHCDGITTKANAWVDGRQIMKNGKYLPEVI